MRLLRRSLLVTAVLMVVAPAASAAPGPSRVATATLHHGVRTIGDLRVGPLGAPGVVSTLSDVRGVWGREVRLKRRSCTASWGTGVRLLFTSFGGPSACSERFLQVATITGPRWRVDVGQQGYRIGLPRRQLPPGAKKIPGWMGGGYELATMPFAGIGGGTTTVMAHVSPRTDRVDRFVLFIGGAED
ncbi:MAG TPA: hypothetical protein VKB25_08955 [Conexibacter sp.]|nr:hypothetical protein [Conexibacter sp.]